MAKLLQVDFEFNGAFGKEMSNALVDIAKSINQEPGMLWKIWTEKAEERLAGGIYLFEDESSAQAYLEMHSERLKKMGVAYVRGHIFDINEPLSTINKAPIVGAVEG